MTTLSAALAGCGGGFSSNPPPPPDDTLRSYVALGDGFTAAPYTGKTAGDDGCLRSATNYPALLAEELGIKDVRDVSCTGAPVHAVTDKYTPGKGDTALAPQIDAIDKDTDLVTIGIGIEDDDLLDDMFKVCLQQPCTPGTTYYTEVLDEVNRAGEAFTEAVRDIQAKAPEAYIVVVGYPRFTPPPEGACDAYPTQPQASQDVVNYVLDQFESKLRSAARQTGAGYVDVADLSTDHVLCSAEPWVHDMHTKPGKAIAYHPLEAEQRAVAAAAATQVRER